MKGLAILGSTGSVGQQCLAVVEQLGQFRVVSLAAGKNVACLADQVARFRPTLVSVQDERAACELRERLASTGELPTICIGREGLKQVALAPGVDLVVSAAVGVAGLEATYEAIRQGRRVALANKEVLVAAGELVTQAARAAGTEILPIDSEHNAIHQCLRAGQHSEVKRLILTASGGPFRRTPLRKLRQATPAEALKHPNWNMGKRITIDSATLMNKGFEIIEACWLFNLDPDQIEVVIHPQSTVHSMVEFVDGSILAQFGVTDMRLPIQYALTYPDRLASNTARLEVEKLRRLEFARPNLKKFRCLALAQKAVRMGGSMPCVLNAADEVAVEAFVTGRIPFPGISRTVERVMKEMEVQSFRSIDDVLACDREARARASRMVGLNESTS